jgi:hypothetical protein
MKSTPAWLFSVVTAVSVGPIASSQQINTSPMLRVGSAEGVIHLDGRLDEPAWTAADSIAALTQIEPNEAAAAAARTVVRVLMNGEVMIIGIRADYPAGIGIVSFARDRDADLSSEDHIRVVIDTYRDGRYGFV